MSVCASISIYLAMKRVNCCDQCVKDSSPTLGILLAFASFIAHFLSH